MPPPQPESVQHHAQGREGHRRPGHDGAQEAERRERDAHYIIGERPEQALPDFGGGPAGDLDRIRHERRIATHQRDARDVHGHVGPGRHRHANIGGGQCGSVVDTVAHHRDRTAGLAQSENGGRLVGGQDLGQDRGDADRSCGGFRAASIVACEQHGANA
jgi:hypothetical protein